jgi:hypothetical protein
MGPLRLVPLGYQQISAATLASATGLTVPAGATSAIIVAQGGWVSWRDDGTAPTAAAGMPLADGGLLDYWGTLTGIKFIAIGGSGSPVLNISYYRAAG